MNSLNQPDHEEQPEVDTEQSQEQTDGQEQPDEVTATPAIQPDQEEQPEEIKVSSWTKNLWKKLTKKG